MTRIRVAVSGLAVLVALCGGASAHAEVQHPQVPVPYLDLGSDVVVVSELPALPEPVGASGDPARPSPSGTAEANPVDNNGWVTPVQAAAMGLAWIVLVGGGLGLYTVARSRNGRSPEEPGMDDSTVPSEQGLLLTTPAPQVQPPPVVSGT